MAYSALAVANKFLELAEACNDRTLTPMKLQKLIYFAHAWHLHYFNGEPLINDKICAWKYGPVIESVYHEFKRFGKQPISGPALILQPKPNAKGNFGFEFVKPEIRPDDTVENEYIRQLWEFYKGYDALSLSNMSHDPSGPWARAFDPTKNNEIGNEEIRQYIAGLANSGNSTQNMANY